MSHWNGANVIFRDGGYYPVVSGLILFVSASVKSRSQLCGRIRLRGQKDTFDLVREGYGLKVALFILAGYLSGSVLYAQIFAKLFGNKNLMEISSDNNPGTANAFRYGGFWCGVLTLICDLLKGFLPVYLFMTSTRPIPHGYALVMAAPVIGHTFSVFYHFRGGKGIAVTFGCLLGLFPIWSPLAILAFYFIVFSVVVKISPNYYRTLAAYLCSLVSMVFVVNQVEICTGFLFISFAVLFRLLTSKEKKEQLEVKCLWMH